MSVDTQKIKHAPFFDTDKVAEIYTEKDGVEVKYVCTSDLIASDMPVDIFFRETPHPKFGNRYFGLYFDKVRNNVMITNADWIDGKGFGMIKDKDGSYWYSQSHHDCLIIDGKMIDGGRVYVRGNGIEYFVLKDGEFVEAQDGV
jgi:hypothetical protein